MLQVSVNVTTQCSTGKYELCDCCACVTLFFSLVAVGVAVLGGGSGVAVVGGGGGVSAVVVVPA